MFLLLALSYVVIGLVFSSVSYIYGEISHTSSKNFASEVSITTLLWPLFIILFTFMIGGDLLRFLFRYLNALRERVSKGK